MCTTTDEQDERNEKVEIPHKAESYGVSLYEALSVGTKIVQEAVY